MSDRLLIQFLSDPSILQSLSDSDLVELLRTTIVTQERIKQEISTRQTQAIGELVDEIILVRNELSHLREVVSGININQSEENISSSNNNPLSPIVSSTETSGPTLQNPRSSNTFDLPPPVISSSEISATTRQSRSTTQRRSETYNRRTRRRHT